MGFFKFVWRQSAQNNRPTVVTFTGGMGAQMISAAIYFSMKNDGHPVYADLSYFDKPENVAIAGNPGDCSHWSWQLDTFGLTPASFDSSPGLTKRNSNILHDGTQKLELGLKALAQPEIQKYFGIPAGVGDVLPREFASGFLCMHVRRGDYVNVASHLVADSEFISQARKFSGLLDNLVVLSDSPIDPDFRNVLASHFKHVSFLDNTDAFTAHRIMRSARVLICSNSQFSLIAAVLNPTALVLIPKQWFGENERHIEAPIHSRSSFQVMA
jgi:Glycosyl transferase family 11